MRRLYMWAIAALLGLAVSAGASEPAKQAANIGQQPALGATQELSGTVSQIDPQKGLLMLSSPAGTAKLHFPSAALRDINTGDRLLARFVVARAESAPKRAYDAPTGMGEHRMTGTIESIDQQRGWLTVKTDEATLVFPYPQSALRGLAPGDRVTVELAFAKRS